MPGFPTRPSRAAFGPATLVDRYPVRNNQQEAGAKAFGLMWWQLAGVGLAGPLAWALFHWDGALMQLDASAEAWDPNSAVVPALARTSAGIYTVTYAATYPDEDGATITTALKWCMVIPQDATLSPAQGVVSASRIVTTAIKKLSDLSAYDPAGVLVIAG